MVIVNADFRLFDEKGKEKLLKNAKEKIVHLFLHFSFSSRTRESARVYVV
tara:strand:- start:249 stop:398 length:150 start_codon:yes stop_codon:yes gene_type:complete